MDLDPSLNMVKYCRNYILKQTLILQVVSTHLIFHIIVCLFMKEEHYVFLIIIFDIVCSSEKPYMFLNTCNVLFTTLLMVLETRG